MKRTESMKRTKKNGAIYIFILTAFFLLFSSLFSNAVIVFAGPDGSGNNFFYKGAMAFGYLPPGKLITEQAFDYQSFNSKFDCNGSAEHLKYNVVKYIYAPQLIGTFRFLGADNFYELVIPFGKVLMSSEFNHSRGGLDDPMLYYGIYAYHYDGNKFTVNVLPQLSITFPYGNWNSSSLVNIGGDEWQFQPALTGIFGVKAADGQKVILNYALGYSINKGHQDIDDSEVDDDGSSFTEPGNNIFTDVFLNYIILNKFDIYDEISYVRQNNNYGYYTDDSGNITFGYVNNGYEDFIEGLGLTYHYDKSLGFDLRALKDISGLNAPDGGYGELDAVYDF